jgi:hypothetical protein
VHYGSGRMQQIIRELKRQAAGEKLEPEQLRGLIRAGTSTGMATSITSPTWAGTLWLSPASTRAGSHLALKSSRAFRPLGE